VSASTGSSLSLLYDDIGVGRSLPNVLKRISNLVALKNTVKYLQKKTLKRICVNFYCVLYRDCSRTKTQISSSTGCLILLAKSVTTAGTNSPPFDADITVECVDKFSALAAAKRKYQAKSSAALVKYCQLPLLKI
jgi:hypothetical protein